VKKVLGVVFKGVMLGVNVIKSHDERLCGKLALGNIIQLLRVVGNGEWF